jgi:benzoyl-CoA reductase/2-hydroxyglutaryl-CoA dehydratase subunit BcrC/BadD/HgdB
MTDSPLRPFSEAVLDHQARLTALASSGRKMLGYFCTYTPVEMLHAAGFVPVRILGGGRAIERAAALTPTFICPYLRQALERALRGEYGFLAGVVQGYTCDVACGLLNVWELNVPGEVYHAVPLPYADSPEARTFLRAALGELAEKLNGIGGRLTDETLADSLDLYEAIRKRALELYERRFEGRLPLSAAELLTVVQAGLVTPPEDFLPMLEDLAASLEEAPGEQEGKGVPVLVSGSVIEEPRVLEILEASGGRVVGDDLCTGWRGFSPPGGRGEDPVDRLMDRHFARFPCPSRMKAQDRAPILVRLVKRSGARGVVFFLQKFCTPHLADLPVVLEVLQAERVRGLVVEMEETGFNEGQLRTRFEAFLEMLGE